MIFIHPMWLHETERHGKKLCTPLGYALHSIGDLLGFVGLLTLLLGSLTEPLHGISGRWIIGIAFGLALIGRVFFSLSWHLAKRKSFFYHYEADLSTWIENGKPKSYKWRPNQPLQLTSNARES